MSASETDGKSPAAAQPDDSLAARIKAEIGVDVNECFQCMKCSSGCPICSDVDVPAHLIVRLVQLGAEEKLLHAKTPWMCLGCQTCLTRCPNKVNLPALNDWLRRHAAEAGPDAVGEDVQAIRKFHEAFLAEIRSRGRIHEASLIGRYKMATGRLFDDMELGMALFMRGKIPLLPEGVDDKRKLREIFKQSEK